MNRNILLKCAINRYCRLFLAEFEPLCLRKFLPIYYFANKPTIFIKNLDTSLDVGCSLHNLHELHGSRLQYRQLTRSPLGTNINGYVSCKRNFSLNVWYMTPKKTKGKKIQKAEDTDSEDDNDHEDDLKSEDEYEDDRSGQDGLPSNYRVMKVHSLRAVTVVAKGLGLSSSDAEELFYKSQMNFQGNTLTKKAKQLSVGDHVDVLTESSGKQRLVKRVQVVHIANKETRSGKPIVTIKAWRHPFLVNKI